MAIKLFLENPIHLHFLIFSSIHVVLAPQKGLIEITLKINMLDEIIKEKKSFYIVSIYSYQDVGKINHYEKIVKKTVKKK